MTNLSSDLSRNWFGRFAWFVLAYNIPVILWGAYVRVSFSGDGCGANWPSCKGEFIPHHMAAPMAIEFTHRFMTSLDTIAVLAMVVWGFLAYPKRHAVRRYAVLSLIFLLIEALLGAGLVLFRLVSRDQSAGRIWYLSAHLTNTMLLLGALAATAWLGRQGIERLRILQTPRALLVALLVTVIVSVTGTITALGDTLFPASSLSAGIQQDFSHASSLLLRLRVIHPAIAVAGAIYLLWLASSILRKSGSKAAMFVIFITIVQVAAGMLNLALLAPLGMQLTHLLIADLLWIAVVLLTLESTRNSAMPSQIGMKTTSLRSATLESSPR
ncbi:MAG: COX15/CtaA family protein [Acidobacteriota bacterium]|nr:COX15/CtaA family protein [Acidobacteriota bacterium]